MTDDPSRAPGAAPSHASPEGRACAEWTGCACGDAVTDPAPRRRARVIEVVAFSAFLIFAGALEAMPGRQWAHFGVGVGVILLAKNLARRACGLKMRPLGLIIGGGALATGIACLTVHDLPLLPTFLVAAGIAGLGVAVMASRDGLRESP